MLSPDVYGADYFLGELIAQEYNLNALRSVPLCYNRSVTSGSPVGEPVLCDPSDASLYRVPDEEQETVCLEYGYLSGNDVDIVCLDEFGPYPYSTASVIIEHKAPSRDHAIRFTDL